MSYSVHQGYFIFGGIDSREFGVYITGEHAYNAAKKRDSEVVIPGRSGTLTLNERDTWDDTEIVYPAFIARNYNENIRNLRNALSSLHGKQVLTDCYHPDEFMLAKFVDGLDAKTAPMAVAGSFDIRFRRDPRRYLYEGQNHLQLWNYSSLDDETDQAITYEPEQDLLGGTTPATSSTLINPTLMASSPLIIVTGTGTVQLGDQVITITGIDAGQVVYIDSEMMDVYTMSGGQAVSANDKVSFSTNDFPTLPAGMTEVSYTTEGLEIVPRWWRV
jgi:phage-related protein